ncbi:hypothetical protein M0M42_04225 [Pseudomonas knackmussii]|uniref:Uncharacterized protein n=1 Tax=Pseudomonas knackmussii TaxID=65741 RepID=A0ABY4KRX9_9PSED|nr:hypothetical protein [Pseudomonas knackmussii]UPQ83622.1 hypothetical protein M0M42_04225 [Pseudomonas knackmussii]
MTSIIIITNCTNRKRMAGTATLCLPQKPFASLDEMTDEWVGQIRAKGLGTLPAASLYAGRSVMDAKRAAQFVDARLMFASTGLGLIDSDYPSPSYNLTVGSEDDSIRPKLAKLDAAPSHWWTHLNVRFRSRSPIAELATQSAVELVLIALSANYIDLIRDDLLDLNACSRSKLRIFTSRPGVERLPHDLKPYAMPYDDRLEGSDLAGTRADYPQRALRHFVEQGWTTCSLPDARRAVTGAMSELAFASKVSRRRTSDEEVKSLLAKAWAKHNGSSSRLLRHLRDDVRVSCEQSRFRKLWTELKSEYTARTKA